MSDEELDSFLWRFYAEVRSKDGEEYSRSTLLGMRNAVERQLSLHDRHLKIAKNPVFKRSNKMLESKLKVLRKAGKENVQHKPIIDGVDLQKAIQSPFTSPDNPQGLLRRVWFFITLHWCRRGCEGQRFLRRDSFGFEKDAEGQEYAYITHQVASKNHQGGFEDKPSDETMTRVYNTGQRGDAFWCLKYYLSKLNPHQEAFFQRPRPSAQATELVWYENKPIGVNKLSSMMKEISVGAKLSKVYTNHCIRASAITLLANNNIPSRHIMSVSGHTNEQSLASYNSRPSTAQLKRFSEIFSTAVLGHQDSESTTSCSGPCSASSTSSSEICSPNPLVGPEKSIFQSCNIGQAHVFVFQSNK